MPSRKSIHDETTTCSPRLPHWVPAKVSSQLSRPEARARGERNRNGQLSPLPPMGATSGSLRRNYFVGISGGWFNFWLSLSMLSASKYFLDKFQQPRKQLASNFFSVTSAPALGTWFLFRLQCSLSGAVTWVPYGVVQTHQSQRQHCHAYSLTSTWSFWSKRELNVMGMKKPEINCCAFVYLRHSVCYTDVLSSSVSVCPQG